jgi:diacylglycerol kinase family enzyme
MRIALIYNPTAGSGLEPDDLVELLREAGHDVEAISTKDDWQRALPGRTDLLVAAGGDGTVRKVALEAADRGVPFAILPFGTANNIGKTLGLGGDVRSVIGDWDHGKPTAFDIGEVTSDAGTRRFVESVGGGLFAELIARGQQVDFNMFWVVRVFVI